MTKPTHPSPRPPSGHIARRRLDHRYDLAAGRLLRVLGPAGYGKTSLVSRWVDGDDRTVVWIDLERVHNDPVALVDELRDALTGVVDIPRVSSVHAGSDDANVAAIRRAFAEAPAGGIDPFVLVLDDVHRLSHPVPAWIVETLARQLPTSSTLVLVGRAHHDHGSVPRLALAPGVVDVTVEDLSFDESESAELLGSLGVDHHDPETVRLLSLTDGWPAGVALAAHAIQQGASAPNAADDVVIADYLRSEWLAQLEPDDLGFLREAACLRRFTSAMCDEVLERERSAEILRRLHREATVVFPLDRRDEWYRMHPLLARWLSTDLRRSAPDRWAHVQRRASSYWVAHGDVDRAVEHAQALGDLDLQEQLVVSHGSAYFPRSRGVTIRSWLDAFPGDRVRSSPGLTALTCLTELHEGNGRGVAQWLRVHDEASGSSAAVSSELRWWTKVLHAAFDEVPTATSIPLAEEACDNLSDGPWAPFGFFVLGGLRFLGGDVEAARDVLEAGVLRAELSDTPLLQVHCLAMSSVIADCVGDRAAAEQACRSAAELVEQRHLHLVPVTAPSIAVLALSQARHGELDDARMHVDAARRALAGLSNLAPWFNVAARIPLARTSLLLDDHTTSSELVREAEHHLRLEPVRGADAVSGAAHCVHELRRCVEAMHRPATGASSLTSAEVRVLHHLPSNLSLSDIAGRLFLSRNTVKSHTASIYRKLGVENRRDAVERATSAGLLEHVDLTRRT